MPSETVFKAILWLLRENLLTLRRFIKVRKIRTFLNPKQAFVTVALTIHTNGQTPQNKEHTPSQ